MASSEGSACGATDVRRLVASCLPQDATDAARLQFQAIERLSDQLVAFEAAVTTGWTLAGRRTYRTPP